MVVQQYRGQCRCIHIELLVFRYLCRQFGVQRMNTLHHQHLVALQLQFASTHLALSGMEVIARQFHFLAPHQRIHLIVQQFDVQCMQMLIVVVTAGIARSAFATHEIIVQRNAHRSDAVHCQVYRQSLTRGGLTR